MMLTGPQGVGKTTDLGQLALGLAGVPGFEELYGFPIRPLPAGRLVLYLALDRPRQIARALRRMAPEAHRALIAERMIVQQGSDPSRRRNFLTRPASSRSGPNRSRSEPCSWIRSKTCRQSCRTRRQARP
jgi:hypothetical protein